MVTPSILSLERFYSSKPRYEQKSTCSVRVEMPGSATALVLERGRGVSWNEFSCCMISHGQDNE